MRVPFVCTTTCNAVNDFVSCCYDIFDGRMPVREGGIKHREELFVTLDAGQDNNQ
jgi:hypothetical protein